MADYTENRKNSYCLRYAGGIYWLLDCGQEGIPYKEPIPMNEVGADIWQLLSEGKTDEEIIGWISAEYGVDKGVIRQDVLQFKEQLAGEKYE